MPQLDGKYFDAHCHVFNLEYLFLELAQMAWDHIIGRYPKNTDFLLKAAASPLDRIKLFFKWCIQLGAAAIRSEEDNADFVINKARGVFNKDICITPLMMDIYYMFYPPVLPRKNNVKPGTIPAMKTSGDPEKDFKNFIQGVITENQAEIEKANKEIKANAELQAENKKQFENADIKNMINIAAEQVKTAIAQVKVFTGYYTTPGFQHEIDCLAALRKKHPDSIYPFLAVDPRREGLIKYICDGNLVNKSNGPFFGIKIYPQLGYQPDITEYGPLYKYCDEKQIPITTHCSYGGFPSCIFKDWPYCNYGDPKNYGSVFETYRNLKINLAHFGDSAANVPWADTIAQLIKDYPDRVFSDMSCTSHIEDLEKWAKNPNYGQNSDILSQTMFGSDFDVLYFTNPGKIILEDYDQYFVDTFQQSDLEKMMGETSRRFLS